eukprot:355955-Chlamydomonas_euryale.AAC.11
MSQWRSGPRAVVHCRPYCSPRDTVVPPIGAHVRFETVKRYNKAQPTSRHQSSQLYKILTMLSQHSQQ